MSLTYQEIHDTQPSLSKTLALLEEKSGPLQAYLGEGNRTIVYVGCGSSYALAKSFASMTFTELRRPSFAVAGGDLMLHADRYAKSIDGAALVVVSRSGSTSEILMAVDALKRLDCRFDIVSFCCVENSALCGISRFAVEMPWAFDRSVCQTRCVTNLYFCGAWLIAKAAGNEAICGDLGRVVSGLDAFMASAEPVLKDIAHKDWSHAVVFADAEIGGIAEEGALAYKEICQLPSNFYNLLDARHGPMVLFGGKTLAVMALADAKEKRELDMVSDVAGKGACVVVYSDVPLAMEGVSNVTFGETLAHVARGIPFILMHQLLAYHKAGQTGANPDAPDGLDAWIKL